MELNTELLGTKDGAGTNLFLKEGKEENVITDKNLKIRGRKTKRQQRRSTVRSDTNIREDFFLPILVKLCSATFAWDGGGRRGEGEAGGKGMKHVRSDETTALQRCCPKNSSSG